MLVRRPLRTTLVAAIAALASALAPASAVAGSGASVYPGAILNSDIGQCTENFLFDGADGSRYIGSAGHCVLSAPDLGGANVGERMWAPGSGPVAKDGHGNRIGEWAYAILQSPKDFSLIRLDPTVLATPQMPTFGGPTGIFDVLASNTVTLQFYGEGVVVGDVAPARNAVALGTPDPDHVYAQGVVVPGDSGSAIDTADGRAVGVIVTTGVHGASVPPSTDAGAIGITRLSPQLARASQVLGLKLTLRTAPLLNGSAANVVAPTTGTTPVHASSGRGDNSSPAGSRSGAKPKHKHSAKHKHGAKHKHSAKAKRRHPSKTHSSHKR